MAAEPAPPRRRLLPALLALLCTPAALGCQPPSTIKEATPEEVRAFFDGRRVLTFVGYSGAEYEDKAVMLEQVARILDRHDPKDTVVNIGATAEGIGAAYEVAKRKGFTTAGIVSTQAKAHRVVLSPCVDIVFFVPDATWGGYLPGTATLSPTSRALVQISTSIVAIGGGEVARDESIAARKAGKRVQFLAADFNHGIARARAAQRGQPPPTDFRGAAATAF